MAHCERGMMLKSSSSSRVVWEDFQGALRTHAAPHGNLKTGETPSTNERLGGGKHCWKEPEGLLDYQINNLRFANFQ